MELIPFGEDGWLIVTDDPIAIAAALDRQGLDDIVPGERHVLLRGPRERALAAVEALPDDPPRPATRAPITLHAEWDGPDLQHVGEATGLGEETVIALLREVTLTVAFCGFAPGFAYMTGLDQRLHLPRRERPRPQVPAGSIAIAAGYCAIYPTGSPGGWHLVGRCDARLFDADHEPPARLAPGDQVRFV